MIGYSISVVIPNYNGRDILSSTLPTLLDALQFCNIDFEIIVCDDASTDESVSFLKTDFPQITIIENDVNMGFSPTINKGILKASHDLVFLMNNDIKLEKDYFSPLFRYFDKSDSFGVMGRIIGWDNDLIQDGAKYPRMEGFKLKTNGNYISLNPGKNDWLFSIYLSGANALVDRKKLLLLGGFDEIFAPFYVEDYDLSLRAWRVGWKCYYEHFAVCRHATSITIKKKCNKKFIKTIYNRNKMILHAIHFSGYRLFLWYLSVFPETILKILTGQLYHVKSVFLFFKKNHDIRKSKEKLYFVCKSTKTCLNVMDIISFFKNSLKKIPVRKF